MQLLSLLPLFCFYSLLIPASQAEQTILTDRALLHFSGPSTHHYHTQNNEDNRSSTSDIGSFGLKKLFITGIKMGFVYGISKFISSEIAHKLQKGAQKCAPSIFGIDSSTLLEQQKILAQRFAELDIAEKEQKQIEATNSIIKHQQERIALLEKNAQSPQEKDALCKLKRENLESVALLSKQILSWQQWKLQGSSNKLSCPK